MAVIIVARTSAADDQSLSVGNSFDSSYLVRETRENFYRRVRFQNYRARVIVFLYRIN